MGIDRFTHSRPHDDFTTFNDYYIERRNREILDSEKRAYISDGGIDGIIMSGDMNKELALDVSDDGVQQRFVIMRKIPEKQVSSFITISSLEVINVRTDNAMDFRTLYHPQATLKNDKRTGKQIKSHYWIDDRTYDIWGPKKWFMEDFRYNCKRLAHIIWIMNGHNKYFTCEIDDYNNNRPPKYHNDMSSLYEFITKDVVYKFLNI